MGLSKITRRAGIKNMTVAIETTIPFASDNPISAPIDSVISISAASPATVVRELDRISGSPFVSAVTVAVFASSPLSLSSI